MSLSIVDWTTKGSSGASEEPRAVCLVVNVLNQGLPRRCLVYRPVRLVVFSCQSRADGGLHCAHNPTFSKCRQDHQVLEPCEQ